MYTGKSAAAMAKEKEKKKREAAKAEIEKNVLAVRGSSCRSKIPMRAFRPT